METYVTEDIAALESDWQRLWMRCPHPHLSYEWHLAWNQHLRDEACALFIVAKDQGVVAGIAPLVLETVSALPRGFLRLRKISFHGRNFVDLMDFLTDGRAETLHALCRDMLKLPGWDACEFRRLQNTSPTLGVLSVLAAHMDLRHQPRHAGISPYLPLRGTFDAYYGGIGKEWRTQCERKRRKVEREAGKCQLEIVNNPSELLMAELRELAVQRRAAGDLRKCPLLDGNRYCFLLNLLPAFTEKKLWRIALLRIAGTLVAYQICFSKDGIAYLWSLAHHPAFESYSPGRLLLRLHLEACFHEGFHEFDFMAGDESYKGHWTREERRQDSLILSRKTWRTRLVRFIRQILPERLIKAEVVL